MHKSRLCNNCKRAKVQVLKGFDNNQRGDDQGLVSAEEPWRGPVI